MRLVQHLQCIAAPPLCTCVHLVLINIVVEVHVQPCYIISFMARNAAVSLSSYTSSTTKQQSLLQFVVSQGCPLPKALCLDNETDCDSTSSGFDRE